MSGIHYKLWLSLECHNEDTNETIDVIEPIKLHDSVDQAESSAKLREVIEQHVPGMKIFPAGSNPFFP